MARDGLWRTAAPSLHCPACGATLGGGFLTVAVPDWALWPRKLFGARWALVVAPCHPLGWVVGRPLGGDCVYLVAEA